MLVLQHHGGVDGAAVGSDRHLLEVGAAAVRCGVRANGGDIGDRRHGLHTGAAGEMRRDRSHITDS